MMRLLMGAVCLSLLAVPVLAEPVILVKDGAPVAEIVVARDAPPPVQLGAREVQNAIREMSGATLPIVEKRGKRSSIVIKTDRKMAEEALSIRTTGKIVEIKGGGKRGAMYGCFAFLEDVLGVRWYNTRVSHYPARKTIEVSNLNIRQKPAFEYREPFWTETFDGTWASRNRTNGNHQRLTEEMGGRLIYQPFVHTFNNLISPDKYFAEHPEYFSMVGGKRVPDKQICLTNPDVLRISIDQVRTWIRNHPEATIFSVSQNDTYGPCECPSCRAVLAQEEAESGVVLRFVNAIAKEIGKDHPEVLIDTLAYQYTEKPPKLARPLKNVRIRIAPISACFGHGLDACDLNKDALANLQTWHRITDQLYVWHYCTNFANYLQPLPCLDEIAADIPLFQKHGVVGLFYEGGYAPGGGGAEMAELKGWMTAKLMWDTTLSAPALISEYVNAVYEPAAPQIKQWLDLVHSGPRTDKAMPVRIYDPPTAPYLSDAVLDKGIELFNEAAKAASGNAVATDEVDRARLALDYVLCMRRGTAYVPPGATEAVGKTVADKIKRYNISQVREGQPVEQFLSSMGL